MKKLLLPLFCCFAMQAMAAEKIVWFTDLAKAQAKAKAEKKMVALDFTGSDWCIWCKKLNAEVFSTTLFADYASKNLVMVEVDFPRHKVLPAAQKASNQALAKKYQIKGYPTVIILDADGNLLGHAGYHEGAAPYFIQRVESMKKP